MANIRFLARAEVDLDDAVTWFEERSEPAARRFEWEVTAALDRSARMPELYSLIDDCHRICPVKKSQFLDHCWSYEDLVELIDRDEAER